MNVSIAMIASGLAIVGTLAGGVFVLEDRYQNVTEANQQREDITAQVELVGRRLDGKIELDRWYRNDAAIRSYNVYNPRDCNRYKKDTKRRCVNLFRQRRDIETRLTSMGIPIPRVR